MKESDYDDPGSKIGISKKEAWEHVKALSRNYKRAKRSGKTLLASAYKKYARQFIESLPRSHWTYVQEKARLHKKSAEF